jgi:hypothetical protein
MKRDKLRILRYVHYDMGGIVDYNQEMVLLYWSFQNKSFDIIDRNKFIEIYDQIEAQILNKGRKNQSNLDFNKTTEYCRQLCMKRTTRLRHNSSVKPT